MKKYIYQRQINSDGPQYYLDIRKDEVTWDKDRALKFSKKEMEAYIDEYGFKCPDTCCNHKWVEINVDKFEVYKPIERRIKI